MINFTAVMVTYANRGEFVKRVVYECINAGCNTFFIVDNGSSNDSKNIIHDLQVHYAHADFNIIENDKNMGSAFAFSQAMDEVCSDSNNNEHILFLDDDNVAENGAIQNALKLSEEGGPGNVYFLLRKDRQHYINFINTNNEAALIGESNSFLTFTISNYIKRIINKIFKKEKKQKLKPDASLKISVPCGPYGGMLTTKSILKGGVRPFREMFLYFDDTNYTMDLKRSGVHLWLLPYYNIIDIDNSWTNEKPRNIFSSPLFEASEYKIRYTLRNRIFFELNHTVTNKLIYGFNIFSFMMIHFVKALLSGNIKRYFPLYVYIYNGIVFYKKKRNNNS